MSILIQLLTAFLGSLGFALLFGVRQRHLFLAALGGMLAWGIYLAMDLWLGKNFLSCLAASVFAVVYAEIMAKVRKIPALLLTVPAIIPLVPGRTLYYAMREAVHGDLAQASAFGTETLLAALAIAGGISFAIVFRELQTKR